MYSNVKKTFEKKLLQTNLTYGPIIGRKYVFMSLDCLILKVITVFCRTPTLLTYYNFINPNRIM